MTPEEKQQYDDDLHLACRKLRLTIARLDGDAPDDESTVTLLAQAQRIIDGVRRAVEAVPA